MLHIHLLIHPVDFSRLPLKMCSIHTLLKPLKQGLIYDSATSKQNYFLG